MIAKKTSKNQLTLPKKIADRFLEVDYFDVRADDPRITLVPVRADQIEQAQARLRSSASRGATRRMRSLGPRLA